MLLEEIRNIHIERKLCGKTENALLSVSDGLLLYILSLLRDEAPVLPDASISEWNEMLSALRAHWIIPLLYWEIGHLPHKLRPPKDITTQMRQSFLWSRARCFQMERQLRVIIEAFNEDGISVLVLKVLHWQGLYILTPQQDPAQILTCWYFRSTLLKQEIYLRH